MGSRSIARAACALSIAFAAVGGFAGTASAASIPPPSPIAGYWSVDAAGTVVSDGDVGGADLHGVHLNAPIVGIAATPHGRGFWLAAADGGVFTFGDAHFYGSAGAIRLNAPIVGIARTPSGDGYWLAAADGGVLTYGDARFLGSAGGMHLNAPVVGIAATPLGGQGYRLAASDGGVFTYGNAPFRGSAGGLQLNAPVVGIAAVGLDGYRLAARDGGVFTYGTATFSGSALGRGPISAIATSPFGGYALAEPIHGRVAAFGNTSSCYREPLPPIADPTTPPFVGIAAAFDPSGPLIGGALAAESCAYRGGQTGAFHGPERWHVEARPRGNLPLDFCSVSVEPLDRAGRPIPSALINGGRSIQMRQTQMAGRTAFRVVGSPWCWTVATTSFLQVQLLPFTARAYGDTIPFSSGNPITVQADGTCTIEVHADDDGRLIQRKQGTSFTLSVPAGAYWVSNSRGCTVTIS